MHQDLLVILVTAGLRVAFLALVCGLYTALLRPVVRAHFFDDLGRRHFDREARRNRRAFEDSCARAFVIGSFSGTFGELVGLLLPGGDIPVTGVLLLVAALYGWGASCRWRAIYAQ